MPRPASQPKQTSIPGGTGPRRQPASADGRPACLRETIFECSVQAARWIKGNDPPSPVDGKKKEKGINRQALLNPPTNALPRPSSPACPARQGHRHRPAPGKTSPAALGSSHPRALTPGQDAAFLAGKAACQMDPTCRPGDEPRAIASEAGRCGVNLRTNVPATRQKPTPAGAQETRRCLPAYRTACLLYTHTRLCPSPHYRRRSRFRRPSQHGG